VISVSTLDDPRVADYAMVGDHRALVSRGLFVAEGRLNVARLLASSAAVDDRFHGALRSALLSEAAWSEMQALFDQHPDVACFVVPQPVMNAVVGFNIHRGCLALAARPTANVLDARAQAGKSRAVVLEGVNNPDNIGGIFRSAAALGGDLIVVGPASGDPLYRKAIRTSMGGVFSVPFVFAPDWPATLTSLRVYGFTIVALTPACEAAPISALPRTLERVALVAGAEGDGLSTESLAAADLQIRIPMTPLVDSLNVATAVSIALHHLWRG
jgi:tRNA G18 (ribose-2'-O)-methylase SpoU